MSGRLADEPEIVERILNYIDLKSTDLSDGMWPSRSGTTRRRRGSPRRSARCSKDGHAVLSFRRAAGRRVLRGARRRTHADRCHSRRRQQGSGLPQRLSASRRATDRWLRLQEGADLPLPRVDFRPRRPIARYSRRTRLSRHRQGRLRPRSGPDRREERHGFRHAGWSRNSRRCNCVAARPVRNGDAPYDRRAGICGELEDRRRGILEGYHIRSTHHDTFFPLQYDNINVVEAFGRNSRISFPYRRIEKLRRVPAGRPRLREC